LVKKDETLETALQGTKERLPGGDLFSSYFDLHVRWRLNWKYAQQLLLLLPPPLDRHSTLHFVEENVAAVPVVSYALALLLRLYRCYV
jgi:hypothetical protein